MGKLLDIDVKKVAKLANLPISMEEEKTYASQLAKVLDYISVLEKIDAPCLPSYNTTGKQNVLRTDEVKDSLQHVDALASAPKEKDAMPGGRQGYFVTKGVFSDE